VGIGEQKVTPVGGPRRREGGGMDKHSLLPPRHVARYRWEVYCSCGWSAARRLIREAEKAGREHLAREEPGEGGRQ
jgi:hypothetical protein